MAIERGSSLLVQPGQWEACLRTDTALLPGGGVELAWTHDGDAECDDAARPAPGGLAFDRWCRAYRSRPERRSVVVTTGESPEPACPGPFTTPLGLIVDDAQRLYVADAGEASVRVFDLERRRLLSRIAVCGAPVDVAAHCGGAVVLVPGKPRLYLIDGRRGPLPGPLLTRPCCPPRLAPIRIASGPIILWRNTDGECALASPDGTVLLEFRGGTDVEVTPDGTVVIARAPGQAFARYGPGWIELEPLGAPGYDGGAICADAAGRIAFTTHEGVGRTIGSVARHVSPGTVLSHRMDSGTYRTRWGRTFLDACIPPNATVRARFATTDDDTLEDPPFGTDAKQTALYRRPTGRELPWASADGGFATYEAPVHAAPGRYLWIELTLEGTARVTPRVRAVRIERPGHTLLGDLPRAWSRDDADADFLHRMLAPAEGMLHELDRRAALRAALVDPIAVPPDTLTWLAGFAGVMLDARWPEDARRTLIAEAYPLFRRRGTLGALRRLIEIYLGFAPQIIERWRLRGLGGTVLGTMRVGAPTPTIGASVRETGTLGRFSVGGTATIPSSYAAAAHKFTVLVPGTLSDEQCTVLHGLLAAHSPAHTEGTIKALGAGMRAGTLRVGLTAYVGPRSTRPQAQIGHVRLGADATIGVRVLGSRLGEDSIAGRVRIG